MSRCIALRTLLGLNPAVDEYLKTLTPMDCAKLLYRDHVKVKHANKQRLASEHQHKQDLLQQKQKQLANSMQQNQTGMQHKPVLDKQCTESKDLLTCLLVKYMNQARLVAVRCLH